MRTGHLPARTGVSFIEVILGVVLLGLVAATLATTVSAIGKSFRRERDRLAAAEIASRVLLQRVDDEETMPDPNMPIGYGEREFRFSIEEHHAIIALSAPAREAIESNSRSGGVDLGRRIVNVTVTVWLAEDSGGSALYDPALPHAVLSRLVDPLAFSTHDSAERRLDTQEDIERFLGDFVNSTTGAANRPAPPPPGAQSNGGGNVRRGVQPTRRQRAPNPARRRPSPAPAGGDG
ncbi:MAG TPA: hypothetical protein ENK11_08665 [Phycisphaerales bacterium]|nr:hypothetical protein [Phycisphaerales bacterium]